jgi:hypothetical protein
MCRYRWPEAGAPGAVALLLSLLLGAGWACSALAAEAPGFFTNGTIPRLRITIQSDDLAKLRQNPRNDVPAQVREGETTFDKVAIHLKGTTGSFRKLDDKPAFTLNFSKLSAGQRFHGLSKLHLNNSVEDPSYFNELAGSRLFNAAGVPAPRVTHALVELNGRRLGLYVLKEGFAPEFLGRHFPRADGNLYDTGPGFDVDENLARDQGVGPDDRADLQALAAAAREPELTRRWPALERALDVDRFVSFMAMEVIVCHRDGYCLARNNFRLYHDAPAERLVFLPHGMDQLFGRPDATIRPAMSGLVARAVMETPEGRRRYRERISFLATNAFDVPALQREADDLLSRLKPLLEPREARELAQAITTAKERIAERQRELVRQLREPEPRPLRFADGVARLTGWEAVDAPADGALDQTAAPDGRNSLHLHAGARTAAAWRARVLLAPGRYQFTGAVFTRGVKPLSFGRNQGAGLRVTAGANPPPYQFVGDHAWTRLELPFELAAEQEVELLCELRASGGEAWFDLDSLRLAQRP